MTTVKPSLKILSLLLSLLLLVLSLSACQTKSAELPFELLNPQTSDSEEALSLYRIVLPATCSAELFQAAKELRTRLTEQTGVPSELVYDTESVDAEEACVELLLGNCDRTVCRRTLSDLRSNDYLCRTNGNTVVLGGVTEEATLAALEQYYEELFVYASAQSLFPSSAEFSFRDEYPLEEITLNGFELFEYTVVYDDTKKLNTLAKHLQSSLCTKGGYMLSCRPNTEFKGETKQIYLTLDPTHANDAFSVLPNEHGITLYASTLFGLSGALRHLEDQLLTPTENGTVKAVIESEITVTYPYTAQCIATLNLRKSTSDLSELTELNQHLNEEAPNLVFLGEIVENYQDSVEKMLSFRYTSDENSDLFTFDTSCRLIADLSDQTEGSAELYSVGTGDELFWLLRLDSVPSMDVSAYLSNRTCPLLILLETELSEPISQPPRITDDRFELLTFDVNGLASSRQLFAVYAEDECFDLIQHRTDKNYHSVTVHRSSAFYTKHP